MEASTWLRLARLLADTLGSLANLIYVSFTDNSSCGQSLIRVSLWSAAEAAQRLVEPIAQVLHV
jgi:hypothetical protein